jgi:hypothetical protein
VLAIVIAEGLATRSHIDDVRGFTSSGSARRGSR